jgi:hypothetical protein
MSLQYDVELRNAKLDAITAIIGRSPMLKIMTRMKPADCSAPDPGKVLASMKLPGEWMLPAVDGVKSKSQGWSEMTAERDGEAGHFRIYDAGGDCRVQGTVGTSNADMIVSEADFVAGQTVLVTAFTIRDNNG